MLAIIIPTLNSESRVRVVIASVDQDADRIVISDGMSDDQTLNDAARAGAAIALGSPGRGQQLKRGAKCVRDSDWMMFIHDDTSLPDNWKALVLEHIQTHPDKAAYFGFKFDHGSWRARLVERLVALRCWAWALPYGDQGLLISKDHYDSVGGYAPMSLFEDVDMVERIGRKRLRRMRGYISTSADKYERDGFFKRGWRNFKLLRRYKRGETIESLIRDYKQ